MYSCFIAFRARNKQTEIRVEPAFSILHNSGHKNAIASIKLCAGALKCCAFLTSIDAVESMEWRDKKLLHQNSLVGCKSFPVVVHVRK